MRRLLALAALLLATAAAIVGAASAASKTTTIEMDLNETSSFDVGKNSFVSTDLIKIDGKKAGVDSVSGQFNKKTKTAQIYASFALEGGSFYAVFKTDFQADEISGIVTGGTGDYQGAKGTIVVGDFKGKKAHAVATIK